VHVFADEHRQLWATNSSYRQSWTTAQAALFQDICNVQSVQGIFTSDLDTQIFLDKYSTISKIIPAQKVTANLVVPNLVLKMHNVRSRNYYKVGFNFSLELIRLKLAKFRLNTPLGLTPVGWFPTWSSSRLYRVLVVAYCAISLPN
jgi:hypothetical protein